MALANERAYTPLSSTQLNIASYPVNALRVCVVIG